MSDEYDFAAAERGKIFRQGARFAPPVHLDSDVLDQLIQLANAQGVSLSALVTGC